jgi:phage/plasmid-like protein (TIGR03299 family)
MVDSNMPPTTHQRKAKMSHEIENNTKFYSLREPAWHGLGYVSNTAMSIDEALVAADMDFEWSTHPVQTTVFDLDGLETLDIPEKFAVVRRNKRNGERSAYGPVGSQYTVHSANEIFSFIDELQGGGAVLETVGSLGRGEREFIVVKLPDEVLVNGTDQTSLYLTGTTAFDGTASTRFDLTGVRIVCANTWKFAHEESKKHVKFRHTSELNGSDLDKARRVLELSTAMAEDMTALGNRLLGITLRNEDAAEIVSTLFPFPASVKPGMDWETLSAGEKRAVTKAQNTRQKVFSLYKNSPTLSGVGDNGWGLFNALTEYADWFSPVRGDNTDTVRAEKILLGDFDNVKEKAMNLILA